MKKYILLLFLLIVPFSVFGANYTVVSGDLDTVGSVVKIANEEFYVIGWEDDTHVKLLAKYNIQATQPYENDYSSNGYNHYYTIHTQSPDGYSYVPFCNNCCWGPNDVDFNYDTNHYVYTNDISVDGWWKREPAKYIEWYVNYLNHKGVNVTGRLISKEEIYDLVNNGNPLPSNKFSNATNISGKEWIYSRTYWTGSNNSNDIYVVQTDGTMKSYRSYNYSFGVRPVIILDTVNDGIVTSNDVINARIISGDVDTIGSRLKIGDEEFYIVGKEDDTHLKLFPKYNLGRGYSFYPETQKQEVRATAIGTLPRIGSVYHGGTNGGYAEYLKNTYGVDVEERFFHSEEFNDLISSTTSNGAQHGLRGYEWLVSTGYWVETKRSPPRVCHIIMSSGLDCGYYFEDKGHYGTRPLIVLNTDGILLYEKEEQPNKITVKLTNSQYHLGDTYTIGNEEFYVIGKEDTTHLKLLAKNNLGSNNRQDSEAKGWYSEGTSYNGTVASPNVSSYYRHSPNGLNPDIGSSFPAYGYVSNSQLKEYEEYLKTFDNTVDVRPIMQEELVGLGCDLVDYNCNNAPNWLYSTSYWTATTTNPDYYLYVGSDGKLGSEYYENRSYYGLRPVVTIDIPEESIVESDYDGDMHYERKKAEEINGGNPNTGITSFLYVLVLVVIVASGYYLVNRRSYFKH